MEKSTINNRYQIQDQLGVGGMGEVYKAIDRLTGTTVALKRVLLEGEAKGSSTSRNTSNNLMVALANEFKVLASLRHPNITSVLDYGFDGENRAFFTMPYLENTRVLDKAIDGADEATKINYLIQTLQGLAYLHQRGLLHRDLKPDNILVEGSHVRLIDFGLATDSDDQNEFAGTFKYVAPELLTGGSPSIRSDLYAVGVIAYQSFSNKLPFNPTKPTYELLQDIINVVPDILLLPVTIQPVVSQLLEKDPAKRYANAYEVIVALSEATDRPIPPETREIRESYLQAASFVGRRTEVRQLVDAVKALNKTNKGSAWLIGGESGVGKSRLVDEIRTRALVDGTIVLQGDVTESGPPFQLWRTILPHLILTVRVNEREAILLKTLVPSIDHILGREISAPAGVLEADAQEQIMTLIVDLFKRQSRPIVLILEDLHWAKESLGVLNMVLENLKNLPVVIIGTYRNDERPNLPTLLPEMTPIMLDRLDRDEIALLSASMAGEIPNQKELVELLYRETEGNVFFLVEIMRALAEEAGRLSEIGQRTLPETIITGGIQQLIERRLDRIGETDLPLLKSAAFAGRNIDRNILLQLAGDNNFDEWLIRCGRFAVLEVYDQRWRFAHDKIREAIISSVSDEDKINENKRIAEAIENAYPNDETFASLLSKHWMAANDFDRAIPYTLTYLRQLGNMSAYPQIQIFAADVLAHVDETSTPDLFRMKISLLAADAEEKLGNYTRATLMLNRALKIARQLESQQDIIAALVGLGLAAYWQARFSEARGYTEEALSVSREIDNASRIATCLKQLAWIAGGEGHYQEAQEHLQQSLDLFQSLGDQRSYAECLQDLGSSLTVSGFYEEAEVFLQESMTICLELEDPRRIAMCMKIYGKLLYLQGRLFDAEVYFTNAMTAFREMRYKQGLGNTLVSLGMINSERGDYEEAMAYFQESSMIFRETDNRLSLVGLLVELGETLRRQGKYEDARFYFDECLRIMAGMDEHEQLPFALMGMGTVAIDEEDFAQARHFLRNAAKEFEKMGEKYGLAMTHLRLGWLSLYQKNPEEAYQQILEGLKISIDHEIEFAEMYLNIAAAFAEIPLGKTEDARRHLHRGLDQARNLPSVPLILQGLLGVAHYWLAIDLSAASAELVGVLRNQSLLPADARKFNFDPLMDTLQAQMPSLTFSMSLEKAKRYTWESVLDKIINNLATA